MDLPIFQENLRSSASWVVALEQARNAWQQATADVATRARLLQLKHTLARADEIISDEQLAHLICASPSEDDLTQFNANEQTAARLLIAANTISRWATEADAILDTEHLNCIYRILSGATETGSLLRHTEAQRVSPSHDPAPAVILPRLLENACDWFRTPSFAEIHPVEQTALVYLRLCDLQPFPTFQNEVALLAASLYTERAALPPLVIFSDDLTIVRYTASLEAAFRMLTQPLVEFLAEMLVRTVRAAP